MLQMPRMDICEFKSASPGIEPRNDDASLTGMWHQRRTIRLATLVFASTEKTSMEANTASVSSVPDRDSNPLRRPANQ